MSSPSSTTTPSGWATLFYRRPYLLASTLLVLVVGGLAAFASLPRLEDPRILTRNAIVITPVPGASAERVDTLVTEVLETALQEIPEILHLDSTSRAGVSVIAIELAASVDASNNAEIFAEIRDQLGDAARLLPADAGTPVVDDRRGPVAFTLIVALSLDHAGVDDTDSLGLVGRLASDLGDRLRALDGTELVRLYGEPDEEVRVTVDPARLAELGLTADGVARQLTASDAKGAAGIVRGDATDLLIEVDGELDALERVADVPLAETSNGSITRLGDIARVERAPRDPVDTIARVDDRRVVLVAARAESDQRVDRWAAEARRAVEAFRAETGGVRVEAIFEQERYTSAQLSDLGGNLLAGGAVVLIVIFLIMGWRSAVIVGLALPLVIGTVLLAWQWLGGALHQMSIFGMIIALGLLIDNAIVVADEVAKEKAAGHSATDAVDRAVRHLAPPLFASTLTTVLAFAPILLLTGSVGDFVGAIGISVILAVVASYVLALTLIAALAGRFIEPTRGARRFWRDGLAPRGLGRVWRRTLDAGLRRPGLAILAAISLPIAGFVAATSLGNEFFPPVDRDLFQVQLWLPTEAPIERTDETARAVAGAILDQPGAERVSWLVGGSFPTVYYNLIMNQDATPFYAQAIVQAESSAAAKAMIEPLQRRLDEDFPGAQAVVRQFGQGPPVISDIELRFFGPELSVLQELGDAARRALQNHSDVLVTRSSLPRGEPKLWLRADEDEVRAAGLSLADVAAQLRANLDGGVGGSLVEDVESLPVRVRYGAPRSDLDQVASMPMIAPAGGGDWLPLPAIGQLDLRPEPGAISRYDGERTHRVLAWTTNEALPIDVTAEALADLDAEGFALPAGYRLDVGGAAEKDAEARAGLAASVPLLATLMAATLVLAFASVRLALLLFGVAGLSVGLGLLSTWSIGLPVSFNSILGTLGLIGVALNDSIVVLAAIRVDPAARGGDPAAITEQVLGTTRHVLSTTLTTVGGFLPLLLFVGGDFWPSLAIVLAGGICGASILALVLVPAAYVLLHRPSRGSRRAARTVAPAIAAAAALTLGGCTVGPDYVVPEPAMAAEFVSGATSSSTRSLAVGDGDTESPLGPDPDTAWWQALGDATLTELIDEAVEHNLDLAVARARVEQVRAARRAISSRGLPSLDAGASATRSRASGATPEGALAAIGLVDVETTRVSIGLSAAWEVDLFGGVRRSVESADARVEMAIESRRGVVLGVIAEVARTYTELRGTQRQLALAEKNVELQRSTHRRVADLYRVGLGSRLDAERAAAQLETTRAALPPLRTTIRAAAHRLAVLTGQTPSALLDRLLVVAPAVDSPDLVPVGLPSDLLRRRPDVRAAERRLAAATASVGVATAELYPRFFLTGRGGGTSDRFTDLFDSLHRTWSIGPSISWPVFQGGRVRAGIAAAEAERVAAEASFRLAVLRAVEDVENALVAHAEAELQRRALRAAATASSAAVDRARIVYDRGLEDFLTVLDAERTLVSIEDALAAAETRVRLRSIDLYTALGGGWEVVESTDHTG